MIPGLDSLAAWTDTPFDLGRMYVAALAREVPREHPHPVCFIVAALCDGCPVLQPDRKLLGSDFLSGWNHCR